MDNEQQYNIEDLDITEQEVREILESNRILKHQMGMSFIASKFEYRDPNDPKIIYEIALKVRDKGKGDAV